MALALLPPLARLHAHLRFLPRLAPPRGPHHVAAVRVDRRLRHREPDRALGRDRARQRHRRRAVRLPQRVRLLPAPARPVRGVAHDHVHARDGDRGRARRPGVRCGTGSPRGMRLAAVVIVPGRRRSTSVSPDRSSSRCCNAARSRPPTPRSSPTRSSAFAVGLLPFSDLPLRAPRVLRAARHVHALLDQLHRERGEHRARARALRLARHSRARARRSPLAYVAGAVLTLATSCAPARRHRRARRSARRSRKVGDRRCRRSPASTWGVSQLIGWSTTGTAILARRRSARSSALVVYLGSARAAARRGARRR